MIEALTMGKAQAAQYLLDGMYNSSVKGQKLRIRETVCQHRFLYHLSSLIKKSPQENVLNFKNSNWYHQSWLQQLCSYGSRHIDLQTLVSLFSQLMFLNILGISCCFSYRNRLPRKNFKNRFAKPREKSCTQEMLAACFVLHSLSSGQIKSYF